MQEEKNNKLKMNSLIEIRIHGRGGQGAVTTAELLAMAAFYDGKSAQAFPYFGVERRGSPSTSFVRISDKPINTREQIYEPDYAIIFDPGLIELVDAAKGIKNKAIVNSDKEIKNFYTKDVTKKAMEIFGKPIINTLILGVFVGFTKIVSLKSLEKAIEQRFKGKNKLIEQNKRAIREAYEGVVGGVKK
ncbi:MAG: 2-oxoacid:acceptor oxidoreductase family protein [Nanoarchaeota archaeon]